MEEELQIQSKKWFDVLAGVEDWPYTNVPVNIVGWAASDRRLIPALNETNEGRFYADKDKDGIPQCSEACGRFFHMNGQYTNCRGGPEMHYDMSFWLTDGFSGGHVRSARAQKIFN
jgi:hypothetical protein